MEIGKPAGERLADVIWQSQYLDPKAKLYLVASCHLDNLPSIHLVCVGNCVKLEGWCCGPFSVLLHTPRRRLILSANCAIA